MILTQSNRLSCKSLSCCPSCRGTEPRVSASSNPLAHCRYCLWKETIRKISEHQILNFRRVTKFDLSAVCEWVLWILCRVKCCLCSSLLAWTGCIWCRLEAGWSGTWAGHPPSHWSLSERAPAPAQTLRWMHPTQICLPLPPSSAQLLVLPPSSFFPAPLSWTWQSIHPSV